MFPIRDHNPSRRVPYVTYGLIVINILVFVSYWPLFNDQIALQRMLFDWALIPAAVTETGDWVPLFSSMFLHGGFLHLAGNMLFLWIFGDNLEDQFGHVRYLLFYLACGVLAGGAHILASPNSMVPTVGASGAIAGVMGGYLLLYPLARVDVLFIIVILVRIVALPAWLILSIWFGIQIYAGIGSDPQTGGVAYWAHAGGFIAGVVLCLPLFLRLGGPAYWQRTHGLPPHPRASYRIERSSIPRVGRRRR